MFLPEVWCDKVVEALGEGVEPPDLDRVAAGRMVEAMRKAPLVVGSGCRRWDSV